MADVINLRLARKRRDREAAARAAAENRARFGRTPAEREREALEEQLARERLDQIRREEPDG